MSDTIIVMEPHSPEPEQPNEPPKNPEKAKPQTVEQLRRALSSAVSVAEYKKDEESGITGRTTSSTTSSGTLITATETTANDGQTYIYGGRTEMVGRHAVATMLSVLPGNSDIPVAIESFDASGLPEDLKDANLPDAVLLKIEEAKMKHIEEERPDPDDPLKKVKMLLASEQGVQDFLSELISTYPPTEAGEDPEILRKDRERLLELVGEYFDFAKENLPNPDENSRYPEYFFPDDPDVDTLFTIRDLARKGDEVTALEISIGDHVADGLSMNHTFTIGKNPEAETDLYISTTAEGTDWSPQQLKLKQRRDELTSGFLEEGMSWDDIAKELRKDSIMQRLQLENMSTFVKSYTPQTEKVKPGDQNLRWTIETLEHYRDRKKEVLSREDDPGI